MEFSVRVRAPAKINLHLEVFGKRSDGFHDLSSLFQAVDLYDDISVRSLKEQDTIEISGDFDCPPEKTTVCKAVELFRRATGTRQGVSVQVIKRIPAEAGLGGGSSDAASVLMALNATIVPGLSPEILAKIASDIGSDVPFFLGGGAAIVGGRGELLTPIVPRTDFVAVLVFPGFGVGTAWAYGQLDKKAGQSNPAIALTHETIDANYRRAPSFWDFSNSFQAIVDECHPAIGRICGELRKSGAAFAAMSGSGSSVFGIFMTMRAAREAASSLSDRIADLTGTGADPARILVAVCCPLASPPDLAYH